MAYTGSHVLNVLQRNMANVAESIMRTNLSLLIAVILMACVFPAQAQSISDFNVAPVTFGQGQVTTTDKTAYLTYHVGQAAVSYNGVIIGGSSALEDPEGWISFDGGSEWQPLTFLKSSESAPFIAGYRGEVFYEGEGFILRFNTRSVDELVLNEVGVFDNRRDDDARSETIREPGEVEIGGRKQQTIVPPVLVNRAQWGAEPFIRGNPVPLAQPSYTRMTFHHAACCGARTREEGIAQVKAIQDFHQDVRGWSDIGYHFLLDQEGRLYQGRPFLDNRRDLENPPRLAQGAHVGGFNVGNIGVSMLGCYHPAEGAGCQDVLSPAARDSLTAIFAYLNENYGVATTDFFGHRDQGATSCPGDNNYAILPQLRTDIDTLVARGNISIARGLLDATVSDNGVVTLEGAVVDVRDVARYVVQRALNGVTTTVFSSTTLGTPFFHIDTQIPGAGAATYTLEATSSRGQNQVLASVEIVVENPTTYALGQSFPNPVTADATIRYFVDQDASVDISLYDTSGKLVQTLVSAFHREKRWYAVDIDSGNLANGIYFYRMVATSYPGVVFDETRTLHVVR